MNTGAERSNSLIPWSKQFQLDVASVDESFRYTGKILSALSQRPFEEFPGFQVEREIAAGLTRVRIEMVANPIEVASAPEDLQKLFLDLGIQDSDEIAVGLMITQDTAENRPRMYVVTLVPPVYRPDLWGVEISSAKRLTVLKSGTTLDATKPADAGNARAAELTGFYINLLPHGMTYGTSYASVAGDLQKPHLIMAAIYKGTAGWITSLVDRRMAR